MTEQEKRALFDSILQDQEIVSHYMGRKNIGIEFENIVYFVDFNYLPYIDWVSKLLKLTFRFINC